MLGLAPWELRIHRTVVIGLWIALAVAISADFVTSGITTQSVVAATTATIYVLATTFTPPSWFRLRFGVEALTLGGALLTGVALTLTDGASSPYLLLSVGPPIFATLYGGFRSGLTTGLLSAGLLGLISIAVGDPITAFVPAMTLYVVFVLLVGVIRRLLEDISSRATELEEQGETTRQELAALEETHGRLISLSEDISAGRLNAVEVAATTLETLIGRFPGSSGKLLVDGNSGEVVLASRGIPELEGFTRSYPLTTTETAVGRLEFTAPQMLSVEDERELESVVRPVSIAFANLQLLEDIVGAAVAEERIRLAREMHDEIGPSLASLGLSLDMAAMQQSSNPELASDLMVLRSNVTKLVEDVRATVADLRSAPGPTLTARILQATTTLDGEPEVIVDLDERRPPRPALIGDLTSVITEAMRNAHRHAKATKIIISGQVDRAFGICAISDDGVGFDPDHEPAGHYGLVGMRERAEKIGAAMEFLSESGVGTTITIEWGKK
jgi:two-component system, NarL family, sensor histidine kinase DegS